MYKFNPYLIKGKDIHFGYLSFLSNYISLLMIKKYRFSITMLLGFFITPYLGMAQFGTNLLEDNFEISSTDWQPFSIEESTGSLEWIDNNLSLELKSGELFGAYYAPTFFSGHFEVIVDFEQEQGVALALLKEKNGLPSTRDYSIIAIEENSDGILEVKLTDRQQGRKDILDLTNQADKSRYYHLLDGKKFSVPFNQTARKLRILRHDNEQFLHFYYAVEKEVNGKIFQDWIELAPSREWGIFTNKYFVGLFSVNGKVNFNKIKVNQLPLTDQEDTNTGFAIKERPYTWSGYTDTALVVTFGDAFKLAEDDRKFVFWRLANNVPAWHLNNGALFSYGFLETWGGGNPGCHEPMSDRLLCYSDLEILEDNAVRKVVKWSYELINPD